MLQDCFVKIKAKDQKIKELEGEVDKLKADSKCKSEEITRLREEINQLRDVLGVLNNPRKEQELLESITDGAKLMSIQGEFFWSSSS